MIPPCYRTQNANPYMVDLTPINLKNIKGVEGNFYKINPFTVITDKGMQRGDFGIHLDANVPGSLGCIVLEREKFIDFEKEIVLIKKQFNIKELPLFVQYS